MWCTMALACHQRLHWKAKRNKERYWLNLARRLFPLSRSCLQCRSWQRSRRQRRCRRLLWHRNAKQILADEYFSSLSRVLGLFAFHKNCDKSGAKRKERIKHCLSFLFSQIDRYYWVSDQGHFLVWALLNHCLMTGQGHLESFLIYPSSIKIFYLKKYDLRNNVTFWAQFQKCPYFVALIMPHPVGSR